MDGLLFYKVDRAARNMKDWIALVELRYKYGIEIVCITEPFDETPAGKLNSNMLEAIGQFYSDQLSIRTAEGVKRRAQSGLFPGHAPYGYENYLENGRGLIRVNEEEANNVKRIFELYAFHRHSIDTLIAALKSEGRTYCASQPYFIRSKIHTILTDGSYLGEIRYRDEWLEGKHPALIDHATFERVQVLLGKGVYAKHDSVYGNGLIACGHCGRPVVCELKRKGDREYTYYRCAGYTGAGHPRDRINGLELDRQMLALFDKLRVNDLKVIQWMQRVIRAKMKSEVADNSAQLREIHRQVQEIDKERDLLLTLRMHREIEADTYAKKDQELRKQLVSLKARQDGQEQQKTEIGDIAIKVLELSQCLKNKWISADIAEKRLILDIVCLNLTLKRKS